MSATTVRYVEVPNLGARLKYIGEQIAKGDRDPAMRQLAGEVVRGVPQHGEACEDGELYRIFWFAKNNVEYRQDPRSVDFYATAKRTLEYRLGDCDDFTILICTLTSNLGFLTGAKVISPDNVNWHIYPIAGVRSKGEPTRFVPLDATQPGSTPGWEPESALRKVEYICTFDKGIVTGLRRTR